MLMPANVLHVLAMAAWLGGIAVLVFALRAATAGVAPEQRTPLLGTVVGRFSTLAGPALAAAHPHGRRPEPDRGRPLGRAAGHAVRPQRADQDRRGDRHPRPRRVQPAEARAGAQAPDRLTRPDRRAAAAHPRRGARARRDRARRDRRALELRAVHRAGHRQAVLDDRQRRPGARGGHRRPGPGRTERDARLPVRPRDRRAVRGHRGAPPHRRDAAKNIAKIDAGAERRRARATTS